MRQPLSLGGAAVVVVAAASLALGDFRAGQLSLFLSLALLAVSLDLVWGYSGILSLGQLLPFGIAAYTTARMAAEHRRRPCPRCSWRSWSARPSRASWASRLSGAAPRRSSSGC